MARIKTRIKTNLYVSRSTMDPQTEDIGIIKKKKQQAGTEQSEKQLLLEGPKKTRFSSLRVSP
jgi:hypothetical protein